MSMKNVKQHIQIWMLSKLEKAKIDAAEEMIKEGGRQKKKGRNLEKKHKEMIELIVRKQIQLIEQQEWDKKKQIEIDVENTW